MKLCALILLASASYVLAAVERYPPEEKPKEFAGQEGCYLKEVNKVFPYDTPVNADDGTCTQYLCSKSNNETQKFSCGALAIQAGCRAVVDSTKGYPDCCPKEECDATTPAPTTPTPTTAVPTTAVPTTAAPATAVPTTAAPTTAASSTPAAPSTPSPAAASAAPGSSYASSYAKSEPGKPPVTQTFATPGASASAAAT